jgi:glyoxalase family protein
VRANHRFYTQVLGMRLVKRSVNQDDVSAYHLFYADAVGTPGTDLTFFDWPMPPERRGTHSMTRTRCGSRRGVAGVVGGAAARARRGATAIAERDGRATLDFEDGEGQRLSLLDDGGAGDPPVPGAAARSPPSTRCAAWAPSP